MVIFVWLLRRARLHRRYRDCAKRETSGFILYIIYIFCYSGFCLQTRARAHSLTRTRELLFGRVRFSTLLMIAMGRVSCAPRDCRPDSRVHFLRRFFFVRTTAHRFFRRQTGLPNKLSTYIIYCSNIIFDRSGFDGNWCAFFREAYQIDISWCKRPTKSRISSNQSKVHSRISFCHLLSQIDDWPRQQLPGPGPRTRFIHRMVICPLPSETNYRVICLCGPSIRHQFLDNRKLA